MWKILSGNRGEKKYMKSMMGRSTCREIKQSLGRYLAIMAIVALGVGFFAGLKASKPAMVNTTQHYLEEKQFFDYRLLSTLGFEGEDVEALAAEEGVSHAEGAVSFDILYVNETGNENVLKSHSLTESVNEVQLVAGRMPESDTECVVDSNMFLEDQIGQKIKLSEHNDPDDLEHFKYKEYTITGIVQSSYYIQFERGTTSLGNGKVAGFMYLLPDGFDVDYYTEIFVKFEENFDLYSQEYDAFLEEKEPIWEALTKERARLRFEEIVADAESELADAESELADKKAEAETELADAKKELDDAYAELTDGEIQIADAEKELAEGEKEIADKEQELRDGEQELADNEAQLPGKEQELIDAEKQWNDSNYVVEQKKRELNEQESALLAQEAQIDAGLAQIAAGEQELDAQEAELNAAIDAGYKQETDPDVIAARAQIAAGRQMLADQKTQAEAGLATIQTYKAQIDAGRNALAGADAELGKAMQEINDGKAKLAEGKQEIADAKQEIADGWIQIADAKKEIEDGWAEVEEKKQELADGWVEYNDGLAEYEEGKAEFETEIADAEAKLADARQEIADLEEPSTYVLGRNTNVGYVCFESDSSIVEGIANVFPMFFILVAALVCMTTMNRMVEEQRTQIGVLKALGYSERTIMYKYMFYSGSAVFIGCVGGFLFGTWFFPRVIWSAYGIMYNLVPLEYVFDVKMAVLCLAVSMLCAFGTTWLSCRYELAEVAAQLMRPKSPKAGKRVVLEYIPFIWKRLKFLHKVSVRNIFRYKKRFFMMVIGISGCTALLVTGFGVKDSVTNVASQQYEEIHIYDIGTVFKEELTEDAENRFCEAVSEYGEEWTYAAEQSMDLYVDDQIKALNMIIMKQPENIENFIRLKSKEDVPIPYPQKGELVICRKIAETMDLQVGDQVLLKDEDMREIRVTIGAVCENFVFNYAYLNAETYEEQIGKVPAYKSIFLNLKDGADAHQASAAIMKLDEVSSVTVNEDMLERFDSMMGSMNLIVVVIILCAAALAFIVLYNLTNINITERIREIATIKVLGFYKNETASYVFRENTVLTLIGALTGLVLGFFLHRFVMSKVVVDMVAFDVHVRPISYLYSVLLTFAFAWLVNLLMAGKLDKINMAESLKSVD